jgi:hypothetical protein
MSASPFVASCGPRPVGTARRPFVPTTSAQGRVHTSGAPGGVGPCRWGRTTASALVRHSYGPDMAREPTC